MKIRGYMKSQGGAIAVMAIFLVFFMSALMITLEMLRRSDLESVTNHIRDLEATYCAESGIELALYKLRVNPNCSRINARGPYTCGDKTGPCIDEGGYTSTRTYEFEMYNTLGDPNLTAFYHYVHITSTGTSAGFSRRVTMSFRRPYYLLGMNAQRQFIVYWREL